MKLNITSILIIALLSAVAFTSSLSQDDGRSLFDANRSCFSQCRRRRPGTRFLALDRQCLATCKQQVAAQQQPQPQVQQFVAGRSCWSQCSKRRPGKRSRFLDRRCFGACKAQLGQ